MTLKLIGDDEIPLVAGWLGREENYQWLDFGCGHQIVPAAQLKLMIRREIHLLRLFTPDSDESPIGLVALSNIAPAFHTATLWYVLGDKRHRGRGLTTRAVSELLTFGFAERGLKAVNAWAVGDNKPSIRVLECNHFRLIGRQRQCHSIDGRDCDRLLYDLLASEHRAWRADPIRTLRPPPRTS
jgi:RimJ/RimL family protein N-acetyltransferase